MAGEIFFSKRNWAASSWVTFYVLEYLASHVPDPAERKELTELVENNIPMLDLRDPRRAQLVNIIADGLPHQMPEVDDPELQKDLSELFGQLIECAQEQQVENRSSHRT